MLSVSLVLLLLLPFFALAQLQDLLSAEHSKRHLNRRACARRPSNQTIGAVEDTVVLLAATTAGHGLFGVKDKKCGPSGATTRSTVGGGPNGKESWLTCGISKSHPTRGWTPPRVTLKQIKTISLTSAMKLPNSPFQACKPFVPKFNSIGKSLGLPPILLAAFAMQESSCDPTTSGDDGGAFGLMQITQDKCHGAPKGNCNDVDFNIRTGAKYFAQVLKESDYNLLVAIGQYNGWNPGMSYKSANAIKHVCCPCVNNLDYLHQMLNFWVLGKDGSSAGTFRNYLCD